MKLPKLNSEAKQYALRSPWFWICAVVGAVYLAGAVLGVAGGTEATTVLIRFGGAALLGVTGWMILRRHYRDSLTAQKDRQIRADYEAQNPRCPDGCTGCADEAQEARESTRAFLLNRATRHGHVPAE